MHILCLITMPLRISTPVSPDINLCSTDACKSLDACPGPIQSWNVTTESSLPLYCLRCMCPVWRKVYRRNERGWGLAVVLRTDTRDLRTVKDISVPFVDGVGRESSIAMCRWGAEAVESRAYAETDCSFLWYWVRYAVWKRARVVAEFVWYDTV